MGHKVNPTGFRLGVTTEWSSRWFAQGAAYRDYLNNDIQVRDFIRSKLANASVARVQIDRLARTARITVHSARPGIVIGKKGEDIENLRAEVSKMMGISVHLSVEEVRKPELDATLVAESIAQQLEKRVMFREGRVPLHTLRADIDYGTAEAKTTYGIIGVKVWIFKGEVFEHDRQAGVQDVAAAPETAG